MSVNDYDIPLTGMETRIIEWLEEAYEARYGDYGDPEGAVGLPDSEYGPAAVLASLLRLRARLDRVGEIQARVTRAHYRAKRAAAEARFVADNELTQAVDRNATGFVHSYATKEEKLARAMTSGDVFDRRREAHQLDRLVSITDEAFTVVKQLYWSLDQLRQDHVTVLRSLQFESSLER